LRRSPLRAPAVGAKLVMPGENLNPAVIVAQIVGDWTDPVHHNDVAHGRASRQNLGELGDERSIDDDDAICGASDDVFKVRIEQSRIEGVADCADPHNPIPTFKMPAAVHSHGGDATARLGKYPLCSI
jgi:hypothetical protein